MKFLSRAINVSLLVGILTVRGLSNEKMNNRVVDFFKSKISLEKRPLNMWPKGEMLTVQFKQVKGVQITGSKPFLKAAASSRQIWSSSDGETIIESEPHESWNPVASMFPGFDIKIIKNQGIPTITHLWTPSSIKSVVFSPDSLHLTIVTEDDALLSSEAVIILCTYDTEKQQWYQTHTLKHAVGSPLTLGAVSMAARLLVSPFVWPVSFSEDSQFLKVGDIIYPLYEPEEWQVFSEINNLSAKDIDLLYRMYLSYQDPYGASSIVFADEAAVFYQTHSLIARFIQKYMQNSFYNYLWKMYKGIIR
jgi:hypothetical protein